MLEAIGLARDSVRVTNTVPWRPPGNRTPTPAETEICLPFTLRHIELVKPRVVICLGSPSTKALLRSDEGIMRLRGRWTTLDLPNGMQLPAMAMLHPAYLLRQPAQKRLAWRDLLALRQRLDAPD
jgi:DNA polymerase